MDAVLLMRFLCVIKKLSERGALALYFDILKDTPSAISSYPSHT